MGRSQWAICGVEVKASATVGPSDFGALEALKEQLPKKFRAGVVLYTGDHVVPFGEGHLVDAGQRLLDLLRTVLLAAI